MTTANCGVPVTVTVSLNRTAASRSSPCRKTPPAPCARPERVSPATVGATVSDTLPSTTAPPSATAWVPRASAAALALAERSVIVPPFRVSAPAATSTPSGSASAAATV